MRASRRGDSIFSPFDLVRYLTEDRRNLRCDRPNVGIRSLSAGSACGDQGSIGQSCQLVGLSLSLVHMRAPFEIADMQAGPASRSKPWATCQVSSGMSRKQDKQRLPVVRTSDDIHLQQWIAWHSVTDSNIRPALTVWQAGPRPNFG